MSKATSFLCSTIGRKQVIAVTGLGLSLFVLAHMVGNLLIMAGPEIYNKYGHAIISNPLLYVAEVGLVTLFLVHLSLALWIQLENQLSRRTRYAMNASGDKATSLTTRTMWIQGLLLFVFVVLHLITFKYGTVYDVEYGGVAMRDLHRLAIEVFQQPLYLVWYCVALVVLGLHLSHGVGSVFQTLGMHHPKWNPLIKSMSLGYAGIVTLGFVCPPLYIFFFIKG